MAIGVLRWSRRNFNRGELVSFATFGETVMQKHENHALSCCIEAMLVAPMLRRLHPGRSFCSRIFSCRSVSCRVRRAAVNLPPYKVSSQPTLTIFDEVQDFWTEFLAVPHPTRARIPDHGLSERNRSISYGHSVHLSLRGRAGIHADS